MEFYLKYSLENIPSSQFLYMRRIGEYGPNNKLLMEKFKNLLKDKSLFNSFTTIYSIALDDPNIVDGSKCRYDVGIANKDIPIGLENEKDTSIRDFIGGKYLIFLVGHKQTDIENAWLEYSKVLRDKGFRQDISRPIIERYQKKLADYHLCELCVPIK